MSYTLVFKNQAVDAIHKAPITVNVGTVVSTATSLTFTGKGAANTGKIQQENLIRLLENFADTSAPPNPTVGQIWYDSLNVSPKVCISISPLIWKSMAGVQTTNVGDSAPSPAALGDTWFQRTGSASGILFIYTGLGRFPIQANGTIGGWNQVWPHIEVIAGRDEFEQIYRMLLNIAGPLNLAGSSAIGTAILNNWDLTSEDQDLQSKFSAFTPLDQNVLSPTTSGTGILLIDPTSNDWDFLLAGIKYAVNRLELPASFINDISSMPFVSDGRPAPIQLSSLDPSNIQYPSAERLANRRYGIATLVRLFTETYNVLQGALPNNYSLKGINGSSGTNTAFGPMTSYTTMSTQIGTIHGSSGSMSMAINFASNYEVVQFINSGGAIEINIAQSIGSGTSQDVNLKALTDQRGVIRITRDKCRIFGQSLPLALSVTPVLNGFINGVNNSPNTGITLTTQTIGSASYSIVMFITSSLQYTLQVILNPGSQVTGQTTFTYKLIKDIETYQSPTNSPPTTLVYGGGPLPYAAGDRSGNIV